MDLLKTVNLILPVLGEHPVTSLDSRSPTLAVLLPWIDQTLDETLTKGLWFNTFTQTLFPNVLGEIAVPADTLTFQPDCPDVASVRGSKLINMQTMTYAFPGPVRGILMARVAFNDLPESVATEVFYSSLVKQYITDIGMENVVQTWAALASEAGKMVEREHLRNKQYSTRRTRRYARIANALRG